MEEYNACDLDRLIEKTYGREFNVPYRIMEGQRFIKRKVEAIYEDEKPILQKFINTGGFATLAEGGEETTFQALLNDLCSRGLLKKDNYLIEFDD